LDRQLRQMQLPILSNIQPRRELIAMFTALTENQGNFVQIGQITPPSPSPLVLVLALLLWFLIILLLIYAVCQDN